METPRRSVVRSVASLAVACILAFGVSACGSSSSSGSSSDGAKSDNGAQTDSGSKSDSGNKSDSSSDDTALPDDWPTDVLPIPDGFEIEKVMNAERPEAGSLMNWHPTVIATGSEDDAPGVIEDYAKRLKADGWDVTEESDDSVRGTKDNDDIAVSLDLLNGTAMLTLEWIVGPDIDD